VLDSRNARGHFFLQSSNRKSDSKLSHSKLEFVALHQVDSVIAGAGRKGHVG
jgi:hypothetical protein